MSLTPVINPCHGFSVIASCVDAGDKFIAGDNEKIRNGSHGILRGLGDTDS